VGATFERSWGPCVEGGEVLFGNYFSSKIRPALVLQKAEQALLLIDG